MVIAFIKHLLRARRCSSRIQYGLISFHSRIDAARIIIPFHRGETEV